jgi:hypothetical protein
MVERLPYSEIQIYIKEHDDIILKKLELFKDGKITQE